MITATFYKDPQAPEVRMTEEDKDLKNKTMKNCLWETIKCFKKGIKSVKLLEVPH